MGKLCREENPILALGSTLECSIGRSVRLRVDRDRISVWWSFRGGTGGDVPRGTIASFSGKSARRLSSYLRNATARYSFMGTLTVGDDVLGGAQFKSALDLFLQWFQRRQRRDSEDPYFDSICWFLEFQRRGAPHAHFFYTSPVPWREAASRWCWAIDQPHAFHSSTKFEALRSGRHGAAAYAMKYATKLDQKELPPGVDGFGRWWGVRGLRSTVSATYDLDIEPSNLLGVEAALENLLDITFQAKEDGEVNISEWAEAAGMTISGARKGGNTWEASSRWRQGVELGLAHMIVLGATKMGVVEEAGESDDERKD